ncbi:hypothetical protein EES45_24835 [Streptomyces sp. ADI97-07]|uniref:hypothetical protein n=1 Tax=Streptomyces sp. ADI97-07 TaxID=1522762 RepID=UPI000F554512|nr:hypothetical protein [Streptomyces sp. ADI97-07]RPK75526.1 hypothetical protein EES45_24835 [Streptomyces sp. ADI97-07]
MASSAPSAPGSGAPQSAVPGEPLPSGPGVPRRSPRARAMGVDPAGPGLRPGRLPYLPPGATVATASGTVPLRALCTDRSKAAV